MNAHQSTANPATWMTGESGLTVQVPPRWGDMDAYGHVNNVAILSLLEEARIAVFGAETAEFARTAHPAF